MDLDDRTKVTLYNHVSQRCNVLSDKHVKEPVRVVSVNESMSAAAAGAGAGAGAGAEAAEGAVGAPCSGIQADIVDTVPKTMQAKARRLTERLKRDIASTARCDLKHEGVPVAGSNVVDLVNDLLHKRKSNPTEWKRFAQQLRAINLPMELVGNVARRAYIRQATPSRSAAAAAEAATPRAAGSARRSLSWTPLLRRRSQMEHSMVSPQPERRKALASLAIWLDFEGSAVRVHNTVCTAMSDPQDTYCSIFVALLCGGLYMLADATAKHLILQSLVGVWLH